jgi:hypothetical protein
MLHNSRKRKTPEDTYLNPDIRNIIGKYIDLSDYIVSDTMIETYEFLYELFKPKFSKDRFAESCENHYFILAKFLCRHFYLKESYYITLLNSYCKRKNYEASFFVWKHCIKYKSDKDDLIFSDICLETLVFLLNRDQIDSNMLNNIFAMACENNQIAVVKFILENYEIDKEIINFPKVFDSGNLEIVKVLFDNFDITEDDISFIHFYGYIDIIKVSQPDMYDWLKEKLAIE